MRFCMPVTRPRLVPWRSPCAFLSVVAVRSGESPHRRAALAAPLQRRVRGPERSHGRAVGPRFSPVGSATNPDGLIGPMTLTSGGSERHGTALATRRDDRQGYGYSQRSFNSNAGDIPRVRRVYRPWQYVGPQEATRSRSPYDHLRPCFQLIVQRVKGSRDTGTPARCQTSFRRPSIELRK